MRLPGATLTGWWGSLALRKLEHCVGSGAERFLAWMQHVTPGPIEQNAWLYVRFVIIVVPIFGGNGVLGHHHVTLQQNFRTLASNSLNAIFPLSAYSCDRGTLECLKTSKIVTVEARLFVYLI